MSEKEELEKQIKVLVKWLKAKPKREEKRGPAKK